MTEGIAEEIPNILDTILLHFHQLRKDRTKPYTTILGCKIKNPDAVPTGLVCHTLEGGDYTRFIAKGDLSQGNVYNGGKNIWDADLARTFTSYFEVYSEPPPPCGRCGEGYIYSSAIKNI